MQARQMERGEGHSRGNFDTITNSVEVYYLDWNQHIQELWRSGASSTGAWQTADITADAATENAAGLLPPAVLTQHNDNARSGQNTEEPILSPANVNTSQFGKLFSQTVDGNIYGQPLYVPNLAISSKGTHNVVFVVTEGDSVYAFDADNNAGANATPLWHASLLDIAHGAAAGSMTVSSANDIGCTDGVTPQIGITSTPVVDLGSNTMYVEAESKENGVFLHRLHALDLATGNEKAPGPALIAATVVGTGDGSQNGMLAFNPLQQLNRPGLSRY
jgi:hypothetical protein